MEILNGAPLAERNTVTGFPTYLLTSLMTSPLVSSYEPGRSPTLARVRAVTRVGCVARPRGTGHAPHRARERDVGGHSVEKRKSMLVQPRATRGGGV